MTVPLAQMIRRRKTLAILIVVLVILPLISIVCFPYFMSLTVPQDRILVFEITEERPVKARSYISTIKAFGTIPCWKKCC